MTAINFAEVAEEMRKDPYGRVHIDCMEAALKHRKVLCLTAILAEENPGVHVFLNPTICIEGIIPSVELLKMVRKSVDDLIKVWEAEL